MSIYNAFYAMYVPSEGGKKTYAFMPTKKDSAVDAFALTTEFKTLVEVLHECVALIDRDGFDGGCNVGRFGAVDDF